MNRVMYNLKKFLDGINGTDAIVGGEHVKLYRNMLSQLIDCYGEDQAVKIMNSFRLRRLLVATDKQAIHFYHTQIRQQGIAVEKALVNLAQHKTSVA